MSGMRENAVAPTCQALVDHRAVDRFAGDHKPAAAVSDNLAAFIQVTLIIFSLPPGCPQINNRLIAASR